MFCRQTILIMLFYVLIYLQGDLFGEPSSTKSKPKADEEGINIVFDIRLSSVFFDLDVKPASVI